MAKKKIPLGRIGEREAARFLINNGYKIIESNYRTCGIEIDIIALKDNLLCFIEVKTRQSNYYGFPEEFVDMKKQKKIIRAARLFSNKKKYQDLYIRFDVIAVLYRHEQFKIKHIQHAFEE